MPYELIRISTPKLSNWQIFTNNGNFNNPLPPGRRLKNRSVYYLKDSNSALSRSRTAKSRNQSAISISTSRILSARSITYRRVPRVKPIEISLEEEPDNIPICASPKKATGRSSTASRRRSRIWGPQAWSFSCLHRAVITIDEQAGKDYAAGHVMNALSAWQNALIYCEQLSQRSQLWPENKAQIDEEIARLKETYRKHMDEIMNLNQNNANQTNSFSTPTRQCTSCQTEQPIDQFHERFSNICQHVERTICNKCIYKSAKSLLQTSENTELNCPEPQCTAKFNPTEVRQQLSNANTNESAENANRQSKGQSSDRKTEFIWCAHEGCGSGQFHVTGPSSSSTVTCVLCHRQTCAVHHVKWHKGITCADYDKEQEQLALRSKRCPSCQSFCERNNDSDDIICSKCKYEFCWQCFEDFKQIKQIGPHGHKTTCANFQPEPKRKPAKKSRACTIL